MKVGDRVRVAAHWSSFNGREGVVTEVRPGKHEPMFLVLLDGEVWPIAFGTSALLDPVLDSSTSST